LTIPPTFRLVGDSCRVSYNFVAVERDQLLLMPPSVADWLPEDHLAWFVLDVVGELDLSAFRAPYRADGRGGSAYDPAMVVALLVYAYATGERSSRRIERRCVEDVAFRVITANQRPDHATIARFRCVHQAALGGLFAQVLALCARAGVLRPGLVAIDGTKFAADASRDANRTAEQWPPRFSPMPRPPMPPRMMTNHRAGCPVNSVVVGRGGVPDCGRCSMS
jgi:transposase